MPRERVETIVEHNGLPEFTPEIITEREALFEKLDRIRERGYAFDNEEKIHGLKCVATPITGPDGDVLGAISVSGPLSRMTGDRFSEEISGMVTRSANVIEINTQFS